VTGRLLDTNILAELRRPKPEPKVLAFIAAHPLDHLYASAVTLAEIRFGIELVSDASKRAELNDWLAHKVRPMFEERVLPITEDVCSNGGCWSRKVARRGTPSRSPVSSLTALRHRLTIVSRDTSDYGRAHVRGHSIRAESDDFAEGSAARRAKE
jgi:toxin FitB